MRLRVVAILLLLWEPWHFAGEVLRVLPTLSYRGTVSTLELVLHGAVAALAAGAGLALWNGTPDALRLARLAVIVVAARVIQSLYWSALPNDTMPGDEPIHAASAVGLAALALALIRPRRA